MPNGSLRGVDSLSVHVEDLDEIPVWLCQHGPRPKGKDVLLFLPVDIDYGSLVWRVRKIATMSTSFRRGLLNQSVMG